MRTLKPALIAAAVLAVVWALPTLMPGYYVARADLVWIAIIGALSLNLLTGQAGQVSLGQAAFMAVGAYTAVLVDRSLGQNLLVALPLGAIAAGIVGLIIGLPSLRFRGFYLSLTTLALHFTVVFVAARSQEAAGGLEGFTLPKATLGPISLSGDIAWYYFLAGFSLCILLGAYNLGRTKAGRAWAAVRDRDLAAAIIGIDVARYKLLAFLISSLVAGAAGVLQAYYLGNVAVESYSLDLAISFVAMIIIGGLGSVVGSVIGAIVVTQLPFIIQSTSELFFGADTGASFAIFDIQAAAFGLVIVGFLIFEPAGLVGIAEKLARVLKRSMTQPAPLLQRSGKNHRAVTQIEEEMR